MEEGEWEDEPLTSTKERPDGHEWLEERALKEVVHGSTCQSRTMTHSVHVLPRPLPLLLVVLLATGASTVDLESLENAINWDYAAFMDYGDDVDYDGNGNLIEDDSPGRPLPFWCNFDSDFCGIRSPSRLEWMRWKDRKGFLNPIYSDHTTGKGYYACTNLHYLIPHNVSAELVLPKLQHKGTVGVQFAYIAPSPDSFPLIILLTTEEEEREVATVNISSMANWETFLYTVDVKGTFKITFISHKPDNFQYVAIDDIYIYPYERTTTSSTPTTATQPTTATTLAPQSSATHPVSTHILSSSKQHPVSDVSGHVRSAFHPTGTPTKSPFSTETSHPIDGTHPTANTQQHTYDPVATMTLHTVDRSQPTDDLHPTNMPRSTHRSLATIQTLPDDKPLPTDNLHQTDESNSVQNIPTTEKIHPTDKLHPTHESYPEENSLTADRFHPTGKPDAKDESHITSGPLDKDEAHSTGDSHHTSDANSGSPPAKTTQASESSPDNAIVTDKRVSSTGYIGQPEVTTFDWSTITAETAPPLWVDDNYVNLEKIFGKSYPYTSSTPIDDLFELFRTTTSNVESEDQTQQTTKTANEISQTGASSSEDPYPTETTFLASETLAATQDSKMSGGDENQIEKQSTDPGAGADRKDFLTSSSSSRSTITPQPTPEPSAKDPVTKSEATATEFSTDRGEKHSMSITTQLHNDASPEQGHLTTSWSPEVDEDKSTPSSDHGEAAEQKTVTMDMPDHATLGTISETTMVVEKITSSEHLRKTTQRVEVSPSSSRPVSSTSLTINASTIDSQDNSDIRDETAHTSTYAVDKSTSSTASTSTQSKAVGKSTIKVQAPETYDRDYLQIPDSKSRAESKTTSRAPQRTGQPMTSTVLSATDGTTTTGTTSVDTLHITESSNNETSSNSSFPELPSTQETIASSTAVRDEFSFPPHHHVDSPSTTTTKFAGSTGEYDSSSAKPLDQEPDKKTSSGEIENEEITLKHTTSKTSIFEHEDFNNLQSSSLKPVVDEDENDTSLYIDQDNISGSNQITPSSSDAPGGITLSGSTAESSNNESASANHTTPVEQEPTASSTESVQPERSSQIVSEQTPGLTSSIEEKKVANPTTPKETTGPESAHQTSVPPESSITKAVGTTGGEAEPSTSTTMDDRHIHSDENRKTTEVTAAANSSGASESDSVPGSTNPSVSTTTLLQRESDKDDHVAGSSSAAPERTEESTVGPTLPELLVEGAASSVNPNRDSHSSLAYVSSTAVPEHVKKMTTALSEGPETTSNDIKSLEDQTSSTEDWASAEDARTTEFSSENLIGEPTYSPHGNGGLATSQKSSTPQSEEATKKTLNESSVTYAKSTLDPDTAFSSVPEAESMQTSTSAASKKPSTSSTLSPTEVISPKFDSGMVTVMSTQDSENIDSTVLTTEEGSRINLSTREDVSTSPNVGGGDSNQTTDHTDTSPTNGQENILHTPLPDKISGETKDSGFPETNVGDNTSNKNIDEGKYEKHDRKDKDDSDYDENIIPGQDEFDPMNKYTKNKKSSSNLLSSGKDNESLREDTADIVTPAPESLSKIENSSHTNDSTEVRVSSQDINKTDSSLPEANKHAKTNSTGTDSLAPEDYDYGVESASNSSENAVLEKISSIYSRTKPPPIMHSAPTGASLGVNGTTFHSLPGFSRKGGHAGVTTTRPSPVGSVTEPSLPDGGPGLIAPSRSLYTTVTSLPYWCSFDYDFCGITSPSKLKWKRWKGRKGFITPIYRDHTSGKGFYAFTDLNINIPTGTSGALVLPTLRYKGTACLHFAYIAPNTDSSPLTVLLSDEGKRSRVVKLQLSDVTEWRVFQTELKVTGNFKIIFHTQRNEGYKYIGLDDVRVEACADGRDKDTTTVGPEIDTPMSSTPEPPFYMMTSMPSVDSTPSPEIHGSSELSLLETEDSRFNMSVSSPISTSPSAHGATIPGEFGSSETTFEETSSPQAAETTASERSTQIPFEVTDSETSSKKPTKEQTSSSFLPLVLTETTTSHSSNFEEPRGPQTTSSVPHTESPFEESMETTGGQPEEHPPEKLRKPDAHRPSKKGKNSVLLLLLQGQDYVHLKLNKIQSDPQLEINLHEYDEGEKDGKPCDERKTDDYGGDAPDKETLDDTFIREPNDPEVHGQEESFSKKSRPGDGSHHKGFIEFNENSPRESFENGHTYPVHGPDVHEGFPKYDPGEAKDRIDSKHEKPQPSAKDDPTLHLVKHNRENDVDHKKSADPVKSSGEGRQSLEEKPGLEKIDVHPENDVDHQDKANGVKLEHANRRLRRDSRQFNKPEPHDNSFTKAPPREKDNNEAAEAPNLQPVIASAGEGTNQGNNVDSEKEGPSISSWHKLQKLVLRKYHDKDGGFVYRSGNDHVLKVE